MTRWHKHYQTLKLSVQLAFFAPHQSLRSGKCFCFITHLKVTWSTVYNIQCHNGERLMKPFVENKRGRLMNNTVWRGLAKQCVHIEGENIRRFSHVTTVLNGLCRAWRSILLMESKSLSQIQMRCTQLWLVLEKHLSEQRLTEGFLNTRQSECLTHRRGKRCARTAEWKTGQRIMMVISSKPKQSHPLIPHSLSPSVSVFPYLSRP